MLIKGPDPKRFITSFGEGLCDARKGLWGRGGSAADFFSVKRCRSSLHHPPRVSTTTAATATQQTQQNKTNKAAATEHNPGGCVGGFSCARNQ
jgi:hypothetical protein